MLNFYAFANSAAGTGNLSFDIVGDGRVPRGVLVYVMQSQSSVDEVTGVSIGGIPLGRIGTAADTAGEQGRVYAYFRGGFTPVLPTGTTSIDVLVSGGSEKIATALLADAAGTVTVETLGIAAENQVNPAVALSLQFPALLSTAIFSGTASPNNLGLPTATTALLSHDFGARSAKVATRAASVNPGIFDVAWSAAADDVAMIAVALREPLQSTVLFGAGTYSPQQTVLGPFTPHIDATHLQIIIDVETMSDPAQEIKIRVEESGDAGLSWAETGGVGRFGGPPLVGRDGVIQTWFSMNSGFVEAPGNPDRRVRVSLELKAGPDLTTEGVLAEVF